ncbi:MAG: type I-E CRISPR-associated protein Cse2/CasB [Meiothermus sp.]|nr:type I-E CRISPR-associated protein Cse2/CasB [Meiothermus sp.]
MTRPELSDAEQIVRALMEHCAGSTAQGASLRRSQGRTLTEAKDVGWFRHLLAQIRREAERQGRPVPSDETIFLIATLLSGDRAALRRFAETEALAGAPANLGKSLDGVEYKFDPKAHEKKMEAKPNPQRRESRFERRLRLLLDAELTWDGQGELPFRLRQCVRFVISGKGEIAWPQLLLDLWRWNWPSRPARREWAQAFYGDPRALKPTLKTGDTEPPVERETDIEV